MKKPNLTKSELNDEKAFSVFMTSKLIDAKDEIKHSSDFIRETLVLVDLLLMSADEMAKELGNDSQAKFKYETIKKNFNIKS